MNKIFKVIWNEARNAYVVVSEIAKNHGSKSCSTKKLLAMLIATGVMTCASFDVLAEQPAADKTAAQQYVSLKAVDFKDKPTILNMDSWKDSFGGDLLAALKEWNAQKDGTKQIGEYTYTYDRTNKYWVRNGYVLTVDQKGGKYTQLSQKDVRADVAYTGTGVPEGILQSVTSTVAHNGVVTHSGDPLQKITAGSFAGVSHSGGTEVAGSWDYIINDASWEGSVDVGNYKDGYVDLIGNKMPKGFKTIGSGLEWDTAKQTYTYKGKAVDYRNMYVIDGNLGVFTNADGSEVYTGTVYGKNNEILMTVKDNGKFYSYWAASVTDPSATMETYPVSKYNSDLAVIDKNIKDLNKDIIKEVTLTKDTNSAIIGLVRNGGKAVDGAITVTSGGGTGGSGAAHDTFVKISNAADTEGKTFATGSKVEAIVDNNGATTGIKINGEYYTIKSGSKVSVTQNAAEKTTTITVDGKATTITDTDTTYTEGDGIEISDANAISVSKNLTGMQSINGAGGTINLAGSAITVNKTTFNKDGRIQNVANGTETKDAVNFGQLQETNNKVENLKVEAGKHTTLVNGENTTVEQVGDGKDGKQYKVNVDLSKYAKTEDVAVVYDQNKTSLRSTNASVAENAIALGKGASAVKNSIAIGNGAYTQDGTLTKGQSVALGNGAVTGAKSTSIGSNAIGGREGTITIGANANNGSLYATIIGTDSVINSDETAYKVKIDTLFGTIEKDVNIQGATATLVGTSNKVDNKNNLVYSGVANNVMGAANTIEASNGVTIQGTGNKVTDAYKDMNINTNEGLAILGGDYSVLAKKQSGAIAVVGGANTVSKQTDSTVIGYDNRLIGGEENISHDVFMAGSHNTLTNVSDSIVMGNKNTINGVSNVISFGHDNKIKASNAVAIGNGAGVSVEGGVALGVGSVASTDANALGYGAAEGETGIAWKATNGAVSVGSSVEGKKITRQITNVAAGTEDTDAVNVAQLKKVSEAAANANKGWKLKTTGGTESVVAPGATVEFDGDANIQVGNVGNKVSVTLKNQLTGIQSIIGAGEGAGSISFADGGKVKVNDVIIEKGGKITGVAAGEVSSTSTDAINGSQLHAVKETANKGWNLSTGKGKAVNVAPGETVDFSGDDNIVVSNTGKNVVVKLGKELTGLTSVTTNNAYVTNVDASKNESVTNVEYVKNQIADAALSAGDGISITDKKINVKLKEGEQNLVVNQDGLSLNTTLNGMEAINGVGGGKISFSGGNVTINNNVTFNKDGRIQNVTAGTENTDAVNYGQLQAVKNELIASDKDTHIDTSKEYNVGANNQIKLDVLDKDGKKLDQQVVIKDVAKASDVGNVNDIADDLKNGGEGKTTVVEAVNNLNNKLDNKVGDLNYVEGGKGNYVTNGENTTTSIGKLDQALKDVAATAAKHTTVTQGDNITVTPGTNTDGSKNYNVALKKVITVESVTANTFKADQTVMDKDGLKVGDNVSVSATAVTAGQTSISDEGLAVGPNTSLKADELKVDGKTYIDKNGLNANGMQITNVADGKENSDAVNVGQLKESEKTINNRIDGVENQVISNSNRINQLGNRVNKVGAGAAALAALHPMDFDPDDKLTFSAGYGNYGGENAAAIGAYYRPDEKVMFSVAGTVGNGENMVNAGVSFALDRTNHVSNSRTALAREVIDLRGQLAVMGAKMAKMEKALGMLDETKTKLFPDIPANHWAYEYIAKLAGNGYIEGYPDGNFGGDRLMTRYEFAAMLYRAIENGAALEEKIIKEFEPELGRIRVDRISGEDGDRDKIERVRVNDTKGERDHYGNKLAK